MGRSMGDGGVEVKEFSSVQKFFGRMGASLPGGREEGWGTWGNILSGSRTAGLHRGREFAEKSACGRVGDVG